MPPVVNVNEKLASFSDHWSPRIIGELNGQHVKAAKLLGEFDWHHHEHEDELFYVVKGELEMHMRQPLDNGGFCDVVETIREHEFLIVPRMIEHRPVAKQEVHIMLFEPASTRNTGNVTNERTIEPENLESA